MFLFHLIDGVRNRFPYKVVSLCTSKNAMLVTVVNLIFAMGLNSHMLAPFFGTFIPGIVSVACGPSLYTHIEYITWYFKEWSTLIVSKINIKLIMNYLNR